MRGLSWPPSGPLPPGDALKAGRVDTPTPRPLTVTRRSLSCPLFLAPALVVATAARGTAAPPGGGSVANFAQGAMKGQWLLSRWGLRGQRVEQFGRSEALFPGLNDHLSFLDHVHKFDPNQGILGCVRLRSRRRPPKQDKASENGRLNIERACNAVATSPSLAIHFSHDMRFGRR